MEDIVLSRKGTDLTYIQLMIESINGINEQLSMLTNEMYQASTSSNEVDSRHTHQEQTLMTTTLEDLNYRLQDLKDKNRSVQEILQNIVEDPEKERLMRDSLESNSTILTQIKEVITMVDELEIQHDAKEFDHYLEAADSIVSIRNILSTLSSLSNLPIISNIQFKFQSIVQKISKDIKYDYRNIGVLHLGTSNDNDTIVQRPTIDTSALSQADLVVDAIGPAFRAEVLAEIAQLQLLPYENLFNPNGPNGSLDQLENRWIWLQKLQAVAEDVLTDVLPSHWEISQALHREFNNRTTVHLLTLLSEHYKSLTAQDLSPHVNTLIKALKTVKRCEADVEAKNAGGASCSQSGHEVRSVSGGSDSSKALDGSPVLEVFDEFLGPYVLLERRNLEEYLIRLETEEDLSTSAGAEDGSTSNKVRNVGDPFDASKKMFEYIRASVKRCSDYSRGRALLALSEQLNDVIRHYCVTLKEKIPQPSTTSVMHKHTVYNVSVADELIVCRIINTAEYCSDVVPQLETLFKARVRPDMVANVNLSNIPDLYMDVVSQSNTVLVAGVCERTEPALKQLKKTSWSSQTTVGDDSAYVALIKAIFEEAVPRIRDTLSGIHFKNFSLKLATEFLTRYIDVISQKRVSNIGAQQLLIDTNALRNFLLQLPHTGLGTMEAKTAIPASFTSVVSAKCKQLEVLLKLVGTEDDLVESRFKSLWPDGKDSDLQMVWNMKGKGIAPLDNVAHFTKNAVDKVGDTAVAKGIAHVGNSAVGGITQVGNLGVEGFTSLGAKIKGAGDGAVGGIKEVGQTAVDGLKDVGNTVSEGFSNTFGGLAKNVRKSMGAAKAFKGLGAGLGSGLGNAFSTTSGAGVEVDHSNHSRTSNK